MHIRIDESFTALFAISLMAFFSSSVTQHKHPSMVCKERVRERERERENENETTQNESYEQFLLTMKKKEEKERRSTIKFRM